jgi:hypothetical protein
LTVITSLAVAFAACSGETNDEDGSGAGNTTSTTNTTNAGGTGGASTSSSTGPGGGPITCADVYTTADVTPCDPLNPGAKCAPNELCSYIDDQGTLGCQPQNMGVKMLGAECGSDAECSGVSQCIDGKCSAFCCPSSNQPCASQSGLCDIQLGVVGNMTTYTYACSFRQPCTLLANECAVGTYCHPADQAQAIAVCDDPTPMAPVGEGQPCMYRNDCGESEICADEMGNGVCRHLCSISGWMQAGAMPPTGGCPDTTNYTCTGVNWGNNQWNDIGVCVPM